MQKNLYQKIWDKHVVKTLPDGTALLYIDRHLLHEVTSNQAFEGLRLAGRSVRQPELCFAVTDHNIPTDDSRVITDPIAQEQLDALESNCRDFGLRFFGMDDRYNGVVHIIGPELGITLPGMTIVCGDSHTATHGAFGSLAFGIGTSEVEHVLATQTLWQKPSKTLRVQVDGFLPRGLSAKDVVLKLIGELGTAGGTGHVIEFSGDVVDALSMEGRMTLCNMAIEAGARAGMVAPDEKTIDYIFAAERPFAPRGELRQKALAYWATLKTDPEAQFDRYYSLDVSELEPQVTWGTSPGMVTGVSGVVPEPDGVPGYSREDVEKALKYMGLKPGTPIGQIKLNTVFIGSCTNGRLEDLRIAARILQGRHVAPGVRVLVVPGSMQVKRAAEAEGLDEIFRKAGAEWRQPGCSMCLAMNPDRLQEGERCASTSNRNFEGRQGPGGRTHLVSPAMAAAAAIAGSFVDVRKL